MKKFAGIVAVLLLTVVVMVAVVVARAFFTVFVKAPALFWQDATDDAVRVIDAAHEWRK